MHIRKKALLNVSLILTCLLAFIGNSPLASENSYEDKLQFRGVRAMGMGNVFAPVADDGDAFYYNPAGLANIKNIRIDIQPIRLIPSRDLYGELKGLRQLRDDLRALSDSEEPLEDPDLQDERRRLMDRMENLLYDDLGLDAGFPARAIVPLHIGDYGVTVGGMTHAWSMSQVEVRRRGLDWSYFVKDVLDDEVLYDGMVEVSYGAGAAVEIPVPPTPLELSFGISARRLRRWRITDRYDLLSLDDILADDFEKRYFDPEDPWESISEGKGYSVDIGAIGSLNDAINLAVVVQNLVGHVKYEDDVEDEFPLNVEASSAVNLARLSRSGVPVMDVILAGSIDKDQETRLGLELIWDMPILALSGRIGSNHGHLTLGAGVQFMFLDFDYAFYGDQDSDWHAFSLNLTF
jgi:hypothetical protein